jgi:uncharacterized 2Fe-2S/4Fe-4S cluster protein (DUF4445 family)
MTTALPGTPVYAIAVDLGTTTLAASLIDCVSGQRLAICGALNPQRRFGADVISRLDVAVNSPQQKKEMADVIRVELRRIGQQLCDTADIAWHDVQQVAIAGNPAMQHILLGLDARTLAFPPYRPISTGGAHITAAELEWDGAADIYIFPMPGGFVGGDTVAFLNGLPGISGHEPLDAALCLDMGTNGEIALISGETIWATSAAAGPAFEGGNLSCGMAALPGAISSLLIEEERVKLRVIGNGQPLGICGSAAIEAVTELLRCHVLDATGRLRSPDEIDSNLSARVIEHQGGPAFVLYRDARQLIVLTQNDIRQLQLAKAAIRAGIEVLFERSRIQCQALKQVILTGSFGAVVRPEWLKTIGIFDKSMVQTTRFTPEGALAGAEKALVGRDEFAAVEDLARRFKVVPLSGTPLFETLFMQQIDFPS